MTVVATSTPAHASKGTAPQGTAPGPFASESPPLIVLSQDEKFLALLRKVSEPGHTVRAAGSEIDFSAALMSHHAGVAVLDAAALATPPAQLAARLRAQFPDLVLIVAGGAAEQSALAAQVTDGAVHRFLHKPLSEQRLRLFVESAWRRQQEGDSGRREAAAPPPRQASKPWWLIAVAAAVLAIPVAWFLTRSPGGHGAAANEAADDPRLESLLQRADGALASGALVAPPGENAADLFREALRLSARDPRAVNGLEQVIDRLLADADAQLQAHHLEAAQQLADAARAISPNHPRVAFLSAQIGAQRERLVLSKAQRAAASGDVSSALAVLDDATRGGAHRSTLVDEARQQLAQKQIDARIADFLTRARGALAAGAVVQPTEQNARFYVESARALAPNSPAVQQARAELATRLLTEAHQSVSAGNADAADSWITAAADAGADASEVAALRASAQPLRAAGHAESAALPEVTARASQSRIAEPATDSALKAAETGTASAVPETTPTSAAPAPAAAPALAAYVSASDLTRTRYSAPRFPPAANERGIEGWVDLQFLVRTDGTVGDVAIVGAEPVGVFEQSALDAVRRWRYQPVLRDGLAVEQRARIRVRFAVQR